MFLQLMYVFFLDALHTEINRTLAIMPFLGADMGAGHSALDNRYAYLKACFWSIYAEIPHVVAVVKNKADYKYASKDSGLPFYDVMLLTGKSAIFVYPIYTKTTFHREVFGMY